MTIESDIEQNQHYSVAASAEQLKILEAKGIIQQAREYVEKATQQRDTFAYPLLARIDAYLKNA